MDEKKIENFYDLIVVGGGAAGFFGAIACAEARPGTRILILEATARVLTKVKVSGGGRCNVTHHVFDPKQLIKRYPRGEKELLGPFHRFGPQQTIEWFADHGVALKVESDGRMFPQSNSSQTIIDTLMNAMGETGVELQYRSLVTHIERYQDGFRLNLKDGRKFECSCILLGTGSMPQGLQLLEQLGHKIVSPVPSLFTFELAESFIKDLSGQSFTQVRASLKIAGVEKPWIQEGPALLTHWGVSGPAILKLSAFAARELAAVSYQARLEINWCGDLSLDQVRATLLETKLKSPKKMLGNENPLPFSRRFWEALLVYCAIDLGKSWAQINSKEIQVLLQALTAMQLTVVGKGTFKEEFVTAGGVSRTEIDFRSMESRVCPGLYLAGEVIDIDGITGGFNFQNAWTGGWLAGQHLADRLGRERS